MVSFGLHPGWVRRMAAMACVVGLLSGCGAAQRTDDSADRTLDENGVDAGRGENSDNGGTTGGGSSAEPLAWVPFGPADPTNPTPSWPVYRHLAQGDCSGLEAYLAGEGSSVGDFGTALVAVCRAAVDGQQDQWDVARSLRDADASTLANDCLAGVMKTLLGRALEWHERNPDRRPEVAFSRVPATTACAADSEDASGSGGGEGTEGSDGEQSSGGESGGGQSGGEEEGADGSGGGASGGDASGDGSSDAAPETRD